MKDVNAALAVRESTAASASHLVLDANEHLDRVERDWTTDVHLTQPGLDIYDHFNNLHHWLCYCMMVHFALNKHGTGYVLVAVTAIQWENVVPSIHLVY